MIQGMGGLMSITGERDDKPGGGPQKVGVAIADLMTGMYSSVAILAALHERNDERARPAHRHGAARHAGRVARQPEHELPLSGRAAGRMGNAHPNIVPYQTFATRDGDMILAIGNDNQFSKVLRGAGHRSWRADPRFADNAARIANRGGSAAARAGDREKRTRRMDRALEPLGVPCGPINRLARFTPTRRCRHRGLKIRRSASAAGQRSARRNPIKFSRTPIAYDAPPPLLGEHTDEVLREWLGLEDAGARCAHRGGSDRLRPTKRNPPALESLLEFLREQVAEAVAGLAGVGRKKMLVSLGWAVKDRTFALVSRQGRVVVRLPDELAEQELLGIEGAAAWKFGTRAPPRGWVLLPEAMHEDAEALRAWLRRAWELNARAVPVKAAKKKKVVRRSR